MPWNQLVFTCPRPLIEEVELLLEESGAEAVSLEDAADTPLFEPGPGETPLWSESVVKALFPIDFDLSALQNKLTTHWPEIGNISSEHLADQPWERAWLEHFHPVDFGHGLWVAPHGHDVPEGAKTIIRLDPGLAFGTGTHPTTALCLRWLAAHPDLEGKSVVDFGCGSGILGVAALKRGARYLHAVDNDPQALTATFSNAEANYVAEHIAFYTDASDDAIKGDIVLANILASTLQMLRPQLTAICEPGSWLILSGILESQAAAVIQDYKTDFRIDAVVQEGDWVRIDACKY